MQNPFRAAEIGQVASVAPTTLNILSSLLFVALTWMNGDKCVVGRSLCRVLDASPRFIEQNCESN